MTETTAETFAPNVRLLGPTQAGKTLLLWSAHHAAAARFDGPQRFAMPVNCEQIVLYDDPRDATYSLNEMLFSPVGVLASRQHGGRLGSTTSVFSSEFTLEFTPIWASEPIPIRYIVTDMAGGFSANVEAKAPKNYEDVQAMTGLSAAETTSLLQDGNCIIQCIPLHNLDSALELDALLSSAMNREKIRRVTICVTKFDSVFTDDAVLLKNADGTYRTHFAAAKDPDFVKPILRNRLRQDDMSDLLAILIGMNKIQDTEIKVIPVSSFGFLEGTGQANTRAALPNDYEMLTAVNIPGEPVTPLYPYTESAVYDASHKIANDSRTKQALWRPFQTFEALFSVLFPIEDMRAADICVFDFFEVMEDS